MFLWFLLLSVLSGIFAGMGMGGGTLLIPILTVIMSVEQQIAQAINLLVFIPCSILVCIVYAKNKLINFKDSWVISLVSCLVSTIAVIVALKIKGRMLSIIFGVFLIVLGIVQLIVQLASGGKIESKYVSKKEI